MISKIAACLTISRKQSAVKFCRKCEYVRVYPLIFFFDSQNIRTVLYCFAWEMEEWAKVSILRINYNLENLLPAYFLQIIYPNLSLYRVIYLELTL